MRAYLGDVDTTGMRVWVNASEYRAHIDTGPVLFTPYCSWFAVMLSSGVWTLTCGDNTSDASATAALTLAFGVDPVVDTLIDAMLLKYETAVVPQLIDHLITHYGDILGDALRIMRARGLERMAAAAMNV